jgi:signal transduction histidine kinase
MLQRFMGDVSHDFKTPLTSIKLSLHLLSRASTPEARQRHLDVLDMQTNRLETFMADLFNMSRYDRGETNEFSFAPVDCHQLIEEIIAVHQLLIEEKQQRLHWEPGDLSIEVLGDRLQLDRMLTNLVVNAITYTPLGGEIWLRSQQRDYWLVIEVRDNGPGIPEEDHERIFQRFYRGDPARSTEQGGMGLGLAIAHKIVEAHGGKIELESAAGQGSTFRISLPGTEVPKD